MDMDKYYLALGRFVDAFSDIEDHVFMTLGTEAGMVPPFAQALFSGTRVDAAISLIRRLYESKERVIPERLSDVLSQLAAINTVRNNILHFGVRQFNHQLQVSNSVRAHSERSHKVFTVSAEMLDDMRADLDTMGYSLALHIAQTNMPEAFTGSGNTRRDQLLAAAQAPWRYKPAAQGKSDRPTQKTTHKPKARPRPSQE